MLLSLVEDCFNNFLINSCQNYFNNILIYAIIYLFIDIIIIISFRNELIDLLIKEYNIENNINLDEVNHFKGVPNFMIKVSGNLFKSISKRKINIIVKKNKISNLDLNKNQADKKVNFDTITSNDYILKNNKNKLNKNSNNYLNTENEANKKENIKSIDNISNINSDLDSKNKLCNICYENEADSILMTCGHGGICNDCGKNLLEKSLGCFYCRKPIEYLLKYKKFKQKIYEIVNKTIVEEEEL